MNVKNIVGQKTSDYINSLKGNKTMATETKTKATTKTETAINHFKRVANARLHRAIYAIELLGNCVGDGYEHTDEQVNVIETKLLEQLQKSLNNLNDPKAKAAKKQPMLL
jgi:hypothetical protein